MKRTKRKKSNRQVQLRWRWRCPWPAPLWLQNLLQVVYHVLYPYTYFCPSFFCFCAAYKRFLPVVVFVSPHFFRFFFLCIFVFICKISSLISVRVRLGPPCVCVCVCVWMLGVCFMPLKCSQASQLPLLLPISVSAAVAAAHRGRLASAAYKYNATCALCSLQFISSHQGHHGSSSYSYSPAPAPTSASALVESFVSCERSV